MLDAATAWPAGALRPRAENRALAPVADEITIAHAAKRTFASVAITVGGRQPCGSLHPPPPRAQHKAHKRSRDSVLARNGLVQPGSRCALRRSRTLRVRNFLRYQEGHNSVFGINHYINIQKIGES